MVLTITDGGDCRPNEYSLKQFSTITVHYYGTSHEASPFGFLCQLDIEEGDKPDPNKIGPNPKICVSVESFDDKFCSVAVELYNFEPEYSFMDPDKVGLPEVKNISNDQELTQ